MRIFRISNLLFMIVAVGFGVSLFWTSQAVQVKEAQLAEAKKSLAQEQETMRVLSVEWDYLNRPQRLEKLAVEQLGMQSPTVDEVIKTVNDIPEPAFMAEEGIAQAVSMVPEQPVVPARKDGLVKPNTAEKQSFEKLIQSLDNEGTGQ